jgi:hypothetical protein
MDLLWRDSAATFLDDSAIGATEGSAPFAVEPQWHDTAGGSSLPIGDQILWDDAGNPSAADTNSFVFAGMPVSDFVGSQQQFGSASANSDLLCADAGSNHLPWSANDSQRGQAIRAASSGGTAWSVVAINDPGGSGRPPAGILSPDHSAMFALAGAPEPTFNMATGSNPQSMMGDLLYAPSGTPRAVGNGLSTPEDLLHAPSATSPANSFPAVPGVASLSQDVVFGGGPASVPQGIAFGSDPGMLTR